MKRLLQLPGSCSGFGFLPPASSVLPPASVLGSLLEKYSGIEFLQILGKTPASGSPLGDAPGPRWKVLRVRSQGPPSSIKWKYSDKGILPYSRIWKSLTLLADQDQPTDDLHYKYRFLNLKKEVQDVLDQISQFHSRQGKVPYLEDLLLRHAYDRLTPAVTIDHGKIYAHCSMSTTLLTGSGHDLQLISRVPPFSLKHLDTSCSLQHFDRILRAGSPGLSTTEAGEYTQRHVSFLLSFRRAEHGSLVHKNPLTGTTSPSSTFILLRVSRKMTLTVLHVSMRILVTLRDVIATILRSSDDHIDFAAATVVALLVMPSSALFTPFVPLERVFRLRSLIVSWEEIRVADEVFYARYFGELTCKQFCGQSCAVNFPVNG
ncbi:hypothetical protein F2Q68_00043859 [Brassica cretica]|uniref:Uncharacterized protein n=1 Tax=Brassica cretica TaxID=69181 RepID=A0A8S9LJ07_BRACR|nr:hypothetical protein F2Q68_00043859 [Brassica cretica]